MYRAYVTTIQKTYGSFFGTIVRAVLQKLPVTEANCIWVDNTYKTLNPLQFGNLSQIVNHTTSASLIIASTEQYKSQSDKRFVVIEFTDFPTISKIAAGMEACVGCMAMERHDQELPANRYPKIDAGYFSRNYPYVEDTKLFDDTWETTPAHPYVGSIDQLFFGGSIQPRSTQRSVLTALSHHPDVKCVLAGRAELLPESRQVLREKGVEEFRINGMIRSIRPYTLDQYLAVASQYRALLALEGTSGFCNREFDILHMGAPLIMPPWRFSHRMSPLIDNVHYLAVDYDDDPDVFAENILRRFNEIRHDQVKRDFIRHNGRQWYLQNCTVPIITDNIVKWVEAAFERSTPVI